MSARAAGAGAILLDLALVALVLGQFLCAFSVGPSACCVTAEIAGGRHEARVVIRIALHRPWVDRPADDARNVPVPLALHADARRLARGTEAVEHHATATQRRKRWRQWWRRRRSRRKARRRRSWWWRGRLGRRGRVEVGVDVGRKRRLNCRCTGRVARKTPDGQGCGRLHRCGHSSCSAHHGARRCESVDWVRKRRATDKRGHARQEGAGYAGRCRCREDDRNALTVGGRRKPTSGCRRRRQGRRWGRRSWRGYHGRASRARNACV